jgi:hypothetical protein
MMLIVFDQLAYPTIPMRHSQEFAYVPNVVIFGMIVVVFPMRHSVSPRRVSRELQVFQHSCWHAAAVDRDAKKNVHNRAHNPQHRSAMCVFDRSW